MMSSEVDIKTVTGGRTETRLDPVAVEEPLEIRVASPDSGAVISIAITMRTPGNDEELASGFLWSEGILTDPLQVVSVRPAGVLQGDNRNVVVVTLKDVLVAELTKQTRNFYMTSSCGICGKGAIEAIDTVRPFVLPKQGARWTPGCIIAMPERLREAQATFERTGGLHAAGLFTTDGKLQLLREDVGRHNAVDKLVGAALLQGSLPLSDSLLFVSGRASFELVQKAAMAGIPALAAVGAPSSLAVALARDVGMTLLGFVRGNRFNIYAGAERITPSEETDNGI